MYCHTSSTLSLIYNNVVNEMPYQLRTRKFMQRPIKPEPGKTYSERTAFLMSSNKTVHLDERQYDNK
jgi:hypothetical protein